MSQPQLTSTQQRLMRLVVEDGANVFVTGGAGVGKSFMIQHMVAALRECGRQVMITASTGVAALLVSGRTLHSALGLGLAKDPLPKLIDRAQQTEKLVKRWNSVDVLVIDEVSMLHPTFFATVDAVVRGVRGRMEPFGGIQVLLVGDFYQLPPVLDRKTATEHFIFETATWRNTVQHTVEMTDIFRQQNDTAFADLLARVRVGRPTADDLDALTRRVGVDLPCPADICPTQLFSRRNDVDTLNSRQLCQLDASTSHTYSRRAHGKKNPGVRKAAFDQWMQDVLRNTTALSELELRLGAQVMLQVNMEDLGLANGSRGVVIGFIGNTPQVQFAHVTLPVATYTWEHKSDECGTVSVTQVPLQLAWAVTIHKAQGVSLDYAELSLDNSIFEYGQAYVALSRLRSLSGLRLTRFLPGVIRAHPKVLAFYAT